MDKERMVERMVTVKMLADQLMDKVEYSDSYDELKMVVPFASLYLILDTICDIAPCYREIEQLFPDEFAGFSDRNSFLRRED